MSRNLKRFHWMRTVWRVLRNLILMSGAIFLLGGSIVPPGGLTSQVRVFTRPIEFDFGTWTLKAVGAKLSGWGLSLAHFLSPESQSKLVLDYLEQVQKVQVLNTELVLLYADPAIGDPDSASQSLREELRQAQERLESLAPLAEAILQTQLMDIIHQSGLAVLGQVIPPSLYQVSDVPQSLVISPRTEIVQSLEISLLPVLNAEGMDQLETEIFQKLDQSALVVPIGGIGTYPTMIMQTADLVWLTEVIAHEWVHNFLTLHPLGINYDTTPELRTINETTASLAGKELGRMILEKYYPEHVPPEPESPQTDPALPNPEPDPDTFDFRAEMRITREEVDRLLAEGKVEAAEAYLETRREFFWGNGYPIRKLNQAYFAFHGAYNDTPGGGASGEDPVGPAVRAFRAQFDTLAGFLTAISRVDSFSELLALVDE